MPYFLQLNNSVAAHLHTGWVIGSGCKFAVCAHSVRAVPSADFGGVMTHKQGLVHAVRWEESMVNKGWCSIAGRQVLGCLCCLDRVVCYCEEATAYRQQPSHVCAAMPADSAVPVQRLCGRRGCTVAATDSVCAWLVLRVVGPFCDVFPVQRVLQHCHYSAQNLLGCTGLQVHVPYGCAHHQPHGTGIHAAGILWSGACLSGGTCSATSSGVMTSARNHSWCALLVGYGLCTFVLVLWMCCQAGRTVRLFLAGACVQCVRVVLWGVGTAAATGRHQHATLATSVWVGSLYSNSNGG